MTHLEFVTTLCEDTDLSYEETIQKRFPAIQYYLEHYGPTINVNGTVLDFKKCNLLPIRNHEDWLLMNIAFQSIVEKHKRGYF